MSQKLLSIVVPTKNRYKYLYYLIDLVSNLHSDSVELLIQDNTEKNDEILNYIGSHNFNFISYFHTKDSISMTENCDLAIRNSKGEYICFIGDDDGFCSNIMDAVVFMKDKQIDNLVSSRTFYNWPDFYDPSLFKLASTLEFVRGGGKFRHIDSLRELEKCVNNGFDGLYLMPRAYQALISRKLMDKVWDKYGSYFPGPSPDMANAVALSLLSPNCLYWDSPLVFSGQSRSVGGGERLLNSNKLKPLLEVPIMPKNVLEKWDSRLPKYWCADSIWPQSAIQALEGTTNFKINYDKILARFVFYHRSYYSECRNLATDDVRFHWYIVKIFFRKLYTFFDHRVTFFVSRGSKLSKSSIIRNVQSIGDAVLILDKIRPFTNNKENE